MHNHLHISMHCESLMAESGKMSDYLYLQGQDKNICLYILQMYDDATF